MKKITAQQHAQIVLNSHAVNSKRRYAEFRTFAKPGETQADAIKRYARARRAEWRKAPARGFPKSADALANTRAYVEAYYRVNFHSEMQGHDDLATGYVRSLFGELSTNPTTWPDSDEVLVEIDD